MHGELVPLDQPMPKLSPQSTSCHEKLECLGPWSSCFVGCLPPWSSPTTFVVVGSPILLSDMNQGLYKSEGEVLVIWMERVGWDIQAMTNAEKIVPAGLAVVLADGKTET